MEGTGWRIFTLYLDIVAAVVVIRVTVVWLVADGIFVGAAVWRLLADSLYAGALTVFIRDTIGGLEFGLAGGVDAKLSIGAIRSEDAFVGG
ncbi:MAG: hypothetical protein ACJAYU_005091 [Bradymonadia bacterium]|jgi:hypothetical protein